VTLSGTSVTVTVSAGCTGDGCNSLTAPLGPGNFRYAPAPAITDVAGNCPSASETTVSIKLF